MKKIQHPISVGFTLLKIFFDNANRLQISSNFAVANHNFFHPEKIDYVSFTILDKFCEG